jgi:hypothetical protein
MMSRHVTLAAISQSAVLPVPVLPLELLAMAVAIELYTVSAEVVTSIDTDAPRLLLTPTHPP